MKPARAGAALIALLAAAAAAAQDTPPQAPQAMQRIDVVGQVPLPGGQQPLASFAGTVQSASAADLRRSQALDISEQLGRRFGGVSVNELQGNPLQADLAYRGFSASPLAGTPQGLSVFIDGVRLNEPFGDVVSWDLIPRDAIARASLVAGSEPLFGLNTLGGAIVLETRDGGDDPGGELTLQRGSGARRSIDASWGGLLGPGLDLFVSGRQFREQGWRDASPSRQDQVFAKLGWRHGDSRLRLSLAHADSALNGNGLQEQTLLAARRASVFSQPDTTRHHATLLTLHGTRAMAGGGRLEATAYLRRIAGSSLNGDVNDGADVGTLLFGAAPADVAALAAAGYSGMPTVAETAAETPFPLWRCRLEAVLDRTPQTACDGLLNRSSTQQSAWGLALQGTAAGRHAGIDHHLGLGGSVDGARIAFRQSSEYGALQPDHGVAGSGALADGSQAAADGAAAPDARVDLRAGQRTLGLFASDRMTLAPALDLTLSARWNHSTVVMHDQLAPGGGPGTLAGNHRYTRLNPAIGLVAGLAPGLSAQLSWAEASRAPTATELGCADPADPCRLPNAMASDPALRQVVTRTLATGLRGSSGAWRWTLDLFRADNRDDILFVATGSGGSGYFRNVGGTRRQGLDFGLVRRQGGLEAGLNLSLLDASFRSTETLPGAANSSNDAALAGDPGSDGGVITVHPGDHLPLLPRRQLKAFVQWQAAASLALGADLRLVGGAPARGNENGLHQADGRNFLGPGRSAGHGVLDVQARWTPAPRWTLAAKVDNLLDRRYASAATLAATPFDARGRLATAVRQSTFFAPGAPRQAFVSLERRFE